MAGGDVVDVHDVEPGIDKARQMPARGFENQPPGRRRLEVARTHRGRRVDDDRRQTAPADQPEHDLLGLELRLLVWPDHFGESAGRVFVGHTAGNQADRGDAAGMDDALDAGGQRRAHQFARALDIGAEHGGRVGNPQPVIGGDVEQVPAAGDGAGERGRILHRALGDFYRQAGEVAAVAARAGQHPHATAAVQQCPRHRRADEPGRPGDEAQARRERHCRYALRKGSGSAAPGEVNAAPRAGAAPARAGCRPAPARRAALSNSRPRGSDRRSRRRRDPDTTARQAPCCRGR